MHRIKFSFILALLLTLQACATRDTYILDTQNTDKMVILNDYELDAGGFLGQKYLIPAQTLKAIKHNEDYTIFLASEGYSTLAVYGSTSPPLGFCVPKNGTDSWKIYINECQGKIETLPDHRIETN